MSEEQAQYGSAGVREVYEELKHMDHLNDQPCPKCRGEIGHRINCPDGGAFAGETLERRKQPLPSPGQSGPDLAALDNGGEPVTLRLRKMLPRLIDERERKGIETYGRNLKTWNGRDVHRDLQEELIDALQYAQQAEMERQDLERWLREALEILARFRAELRNLPGGIDIALSDRYIALQEKAAKALPPDAKN